MNKTVAVHVAAWFGMAILAGAGELSVDVLNVNQQGNFYGPVSVASAPSGAIPTNNLVLQFDFATNTTQVADLSGNSHSGLVSGATWTNAGVKGGAFYFDGVNDYIRVAKTTMLNITGQLTVAFWMKPQTVGNDVMLLSKNDTSDTSANAYWALELESNGDLNWYVNKVIQFTETKDWVGKGWSHITVVQKDAASYIYEDGLLVASATNKTIPSNNKDLLIGRSNRAGYYYKGIIDELVVLNRSLTDTEVRDLYYATGTFTNAQTGVFTVANTITVANGIAQTNPQGTNVLMGHVGIGTDAPSTKLDVNGDATVRGTLSVSNGIAGSGSGISNLSAANLSSGTVPVARLSGITSNQMDSATDIEYRNVENPGVTNHAALANLSYAASGHTGFQPAGNYLTNAQTGVTLSGTFSGTGTALTGLNADNLSSGTVPVVRLSGITTNQMAATEKNQIANAITNGQGSVTLSGTFSGSGAALTSLNAASISSGTIPLARLAGIASNQIDAATDAAYRYAPAPITDHTVLANLSYAASGHTGFQPAGNYVTNGQTDVTLSGTFSGTGTALTGLNADNLASGTIPLARLSGITTNQLAPIVNLDIAGQGRFAGGIVCSQPMGDISMGSFTNSP